MNLRARTYTAFVTVLEVIQKSSEFLAKKGVESARLQTELLLAHALKLPRMKLYLNFERKLSDAELDSIRELVKRRSQREPLQHITGSTSFCGFEMAVNRHVLVPRPETELLAEMGWEFLNRTSQSPHPASGHPPHETCSSGRESALSDSRKHSEPTHVGCYSSGVQGAKLLSANSLPVGRGEGLALDFGTGSGCIAIAIAVKCPAARVVATDVSAEALAIAGQNAARNGVADRIEFHCGDGFNAISSGAQFDLIVSNPPYIPSAEITTLQPEVRDFDPNGALDGGADGLDFYRMLAEKAGAFLKPEGRIMLEFGDGQADDVKRLFESQKWVVESVREDYTRRQRILTARRS